MTVFVEGVYGTSHVSYPIVVSARMFGERARARASATVVGDEEEGEYRCFCDVEVC